MNVKTPLMLVLTMVFALLLCGAVSAGTPLHENQTGTVSGDLYVNASNPWASTTLGATNEVTQNNTLPEYTSIDSARVYVNVYSGSGQNNWPVRTTVKFDGNGDGIYETTLGVEDMNILGSADGTVYWLNDHCNRVYSDYQVWYDVTNLITSRNPSVYVKTETLGGDGYDGRIKMIALVAAYNDGDTDQVHYWVLNGQDWINSGSSTSTFNTHTINGQVSSATLNTVALSSTDGTYTLNTNTLTGNLTETGSYYKEHQWDVTSNINAGADTNLTYANVGASFKMNLATLTIREETVTAPEANFTATPTSGATPLQVQFTDTSSNSPTSWFWEYNMGSGWNTFASGTDSASQNPLYTFTTPGTYDIRLTTTNNVGSDDETKLGFITVNTPLQLDLTISGTVNTVPSTAVFAKEANNLTVTDIKNLGTDTATNIHVALYASDVSDTVPVATVVIESLAGGATTTLNLVDPTIRNLEGGTVTYTVKLDPDNLIGETDENNNSKVGSALPVRYNGYKGKQYWENGSNISTKRHYDIRGDLVYSPGDSSYHAGNTWTSTTTNWTAGNFNIPTTATVKEAWLYVPYNWDEASLFPGHVTLAFNSQNINYANWYSDKSNFGGYGNYNYGMLTYNVTSLFQANGGNNATLTRDGASSVALYPFTLMVVYEDSHSSRKQIFINEEWDLLGLSATSYATTLEEATANAPFTGMTINTTRVKNATLHSFAASAGPNEGNVFFNGNSIATSIWQGTSNTAYAVLLDVKNNLLSTGNVASIQENTGTMSAMQQILVIEYDEQPPVAGFTANPNSGTAPLNVAFTDASTGDITSRAWDFQNDGTVDSTQTNPTWTYNTPGTYVVKLTVNGPGGTNSATKTIEVKYPAPVAGFTANPTSGAAPLKVVFTDASTGNITSRAWDFQNDGTVDSTQTNPTYTYNTPGTYVVKLTVNGPGGSANKTMNITVNQTDITPPVPKAEPKGGLFRTAQTITLTATDDHDTKPKIYYTTDGAAPTSTSTLYTGPISITNTTTLKFIAADSEGNTSPVQSETYTIDTTAPTITLVDPANSAVRVALGKTIKVTFNEAIQKGSKFWIELVNSGGKAIPFVASVSGEVLTIDPAVNLAESRYTLILHSGAVTDLAGNPFSLRSTCFTTGTSPLIKSTDPKNNTNLTRNKAIKVTFNENIKPGKNYWIELKASNDTSVKIGKSNSGKVLTITHPRLSANTKYTLILHTGSITDNAGNPLALKTISFTTRTT